MDSKNKVRVFASFKEENDSEFERAISMSIEDRLKEFVSIQERTWGAGWRTQPMVRKVSFETDD